MDATDIPPPRVSVVICVIDPHEHYFRQAVDSILRQSFGDLELIIIEEPSSRDGRKLLADIADPRLRHFMHAERTDLVEQRNRGVSEARAGLIAVLDSDDIADPERIQKQYDYMIVHSDVGVLSSNLQLIDSEDREIGFRHYPLSPEDVSRALRRYNPIAQPAVMYRKALFEQVGGYTYRDHAVEDYELWCRFDAHGIKQANLVEPLVRYRVHPGGQKSSKLRSVLGGTIRIKERYYSGQMNTRARLRLAIEKVLIRVPAPLIIRLFLWTAIRNSRPAGP